MFEQRRYEQKVEASHTDQVVSVRVSSEEMVKLGTLAEEALALLAGGGSWSYSVNAILSFKRSLASLESIGCCDLSGLVRFAASINAVFSRNQLSCDRALQGSITELVSTLISWGYDPIREPLARALSAGVLLPGSGIELLIPRLLDEPKESHEFYSTVAWCVTHATLPVSAAFEPSWIATLEDRTRATAVSTAWSILRSIVKDSEPSQVEHLESLLKQPESRQVAEELMRMLYYGDEKAVEKLPVLLDLLRVRNQGQTEATSLHMRRKPLLYSATIKRRGFLTLSRGSPQP